jgi:hypothetical protein
VSDYCQSCGADIVFVPSAKSGKPMILDAKPEKRIVLDVTLTTAETIIHGDHIDEPGYKVARVVNAYTDHHATCPKAADWKGRTR